MWFHLQEIPFWARDQCNCSPFMGGLHFSEQLSQAFSSAVHSLRSFPAFPCHWVYLSSLRFLLPLLRSLPTLSQTSQDCYVLQTLMVGNTTSNARNNWTFCIEASGLFDFFFGHFTHMNALASENPRARRPRLEKSSSHLVGSPCAIT